MDWWSIVFVVKFLFSLLCLVRLFDILQNPFFQQAGWLLYFLFLLVQAMFLHLILPSQFLSTIKRSLHKTLSPILRNSEPTITISLFSLSQWCKAQSPIIRSDFSIGLIVKINTQSEIILSVNSVGVSFSKEKLSSKFTVNAGCVLSL